MTFEPDKVDDFIGVWNEMKVKIAAFDGCNKVELFRDLDQNNIFFTYSVWDSDDDLQNYRKSELFGDLWPRAKVLFGDKPEAWSLDHVLF